MRLLRDRSPKSGRTTHRGSEAAGKSIQRITGHGPRRHGNTERRIALFHPSPWLRASVACLVFLLPLGGYAQQLLDRVVAMVNNVPITLSDVNAAIGLGLFEIPPDGDAVAAATAQLIDRQLMLGETARFAPPEPDERAVEAEVNRLKMRAGTRLNGIVESAGLDEQRLRDLARESLRIQSYLDERFGIVMQVSDDEVEQYYRMHAQEFTRNGVLISYEEAEPVARMRAAALRRAAAIGQWLRDLRNRAAIVIPRARTAG
jgi:hypothetical protein